MEDWRWGIEKSVTGSRSDISFGIGSERRCGGMANELTNPVKAIRAYCLECSNDQTSEVKNCPMYRCPLYPFRFGKNPYRQRREMTEAEKQVLADRLREARKNIGSSVGNEVREDGTENR
jgi:hypothetical protein